MLHGVLNMPPELWNDVSPIDVMQRHARYVQASKYIDELETELAAVTEQRGRLAEALQKLNEYDLGDIPVGVVRRCEEALQSLTQNARVRHGAKDADLD